MAVAAATAAGDSATANTANTAACMAAATTTAQPPATMHHINYLQGTRPVTEHGVPMSYVAIIERNTLVW